VFYGNAGLKLKFHIGSDAHRNSLNEIVRNIYSNRIPAVAYKSRDMASSVGMRCIYIDGDDDMLLLTDDRV